jgi:hypothetical protein
MTAAGVTLYIVLVLHNYGLAALCVGLFAPLIGFHFAITLISKREELMSIERIRRTDENQDSKMVMKDT